MDNELIEEIHIMKNHSEGTERIYKHAVKKYTEFCGMSLKELLDEAEAEEDAGIKWKRRKLKRRLLTFRQYLLDNFSLNTVKAMFTPILIRKSSERPWMWLHQQLNLSYYLWHPAVVPEWKH